MDVSAVDLGDSNSVWLNQGGKSIGYFCQKKPVRVDKLLIQELKDISKSLEGKNLRLCLHENPDSDFHDMIIFERKGNYYRPHKHKAKGESYHIIEGSLAIFVFDEEGQIVDACALEPGNNIIYRVDRDMHHAILPLTDLVIYHESKTGPFLGDSDSLYPEWAPDGNNADLIDKFTEELKQYLVRQ